MIRITLCTLALFGLGTAARAGELDKESAPRTSLSAAAVATAPAPAAHTPVGTELDKESPRAAYHHHGWGHYHGWGGWGGWGYRPYYAGFYRPYYGGWGYWPNYASFYTPYFGGFYGGYYPTYSTYYFGASPLGWYNYAWYW